MDKIDEQILSFLSENARTKISYIAKKIHLSETSVIERVKKLENSGVIRQYTTVVDPEKLGLDITAFTYIRIEHPKYNEDFIKQMLENPEIAEIHYITGDYDFLLNPENIGCCDGCPENKGFSDWQRKKPCGQQIRWIEAHCYR